MQVLSQRPSKLNITVSPLIVVVNFSGPSGEGSGVVQNRPYPRAKVAVSIPTIRVALLVLGALIPFVFAHTSSAQTTSRSRFGATLSGSISPAANGAGATVSLTGPTNASATADSNGRFSFRGLASGAYTITPTKTGYTFNPSSLTVSFNGSSVSGLSFSASPNSTSSNQSLFTTQSPVGSSYNDGVSYELGTRFYAMLLVR